MQNVFASARVVVVVVIGRGVGRGGGVVCVCVGGGGGGWRREFRFVCSSSYIYLWYKIRPLNIFGVLFLSYFSSILR